jgi:hypothetical protein
MVMVRTAYYSGMGYTVRCATDQGSKPFQIIAGRRVWLSVPPSHVIPDLLQCPTPSLS